MAGKRKGLGRGLDALLGVSEADSNVITDDQNKVQNTRKDLPIEFLQPGKYQPRRDMHPEALDELAESIRAQGILQPIVVRLVGEEKYEIIAGERRWRASQLAELANVPVIIKDVSDQAAIAMALIENIQREDLNAVEEARALIRLQQEFDLTQQDVAKAVGKSRATVANLMRLMSLEDDVRKLLEHGDLDMGHGRALLGLEGVEQIDAARTVAGKGMTVRQTEELVRKIQQQTVISPKPQTQANGDIQALEEKVSSTLGAAVSIQHSASGKGKMVLKYNSLDELDGILAHIR